MTIEEKIKQILNDLPKRASRRDVELAQIRISLLFKGKVVVSEQKPQELADLIESRPKLFDEKYTRMIKKQAYDETRLCKAVLIDYEKWFDVYEKKFVEAFGEPAKKEVPNKQ